MNIIQKYNPPQDWDTQAIVEIAKVKGGKRLPSGHQFTGFPTPYPYIRVVDFGKNSVNLDDLEYLSEETQKAISRYIISTDDIYISIAGTIGIVGVIPEELNGANLTENAAKITEIDKSIDRNFLMYYLDSEISKGQINKLVGITTQPKLALERIEKIEVIKPPKPEQKIISSILSTIDTAIYKSEQLINKYKSIKQGLMQDLFKYGIGENGKIRNHVTHSFKESPLGLIPEEWNTSNIGSSYLKGRIGWQGLTTKEYLDDGEYLLVTGTDFDNGKVEWASCHFVEKKRYSQDVKIQVQKQDILVTKDGTIGKVAFVENVPLPATLNSGVFVIRPINKEYEQKYLYYVLRSFIFDKFIENLSAGSTIKHLYQKDFVKFEFPLPKKREQEEIISLLETQDAAIEFETKKLQKIQHIKSGLMQDLLTGKVRVNQLLN